MPIATQDKPASDADAHAGSNGSPKQNPKGDPGLTDNASRFAGERPSADLSSDALIDLLAKMMLIRRFEERTMQAYQQAKIGGFCHIYIGQEAVAVGSISALNPDDPIVAAYRDHGQALARGMHPNYCMAEMFGKVTGCAKGKGGSMHMFDKPHQMYGGHAIVGGQCPLGVGLAFAIQYQREDKVALCYLGDGALNQGAFHESMNLAAIYNLPVIFVLENNHYSMGTHILRGTAMANDMRQKAEAYGMRYAQCNGLDVLEVYDTFHTEISHTRGAKNPQWIEDREFHELPEYKVEGEKPGPCFINVETYRTQGHSMSDPQKYRSKDEVGDKPDPIQNLVRYMVEHDHAKQGLIDELDEKAKTIAKAAIQYAEESEPLGMEEMYTDVYSEPFGKYVDGGESIFMRETAG